MRRLGIRIANVALFVLCCSQLAGLVTRISADLLMPEPASYRADAEPTRARTPTWDERMPILDRNLFGAQIFPLEQIVPEPEPIEDLAETKLPLRLLGTVLSANPAHSTAAIGPKRGRDHEVIHEGDTLDSHPQVRVVKIERGRVILQNGNRREELLLEEVKLAGRAPAAPPPSTRRARRSRRTTTTPTERLGLSERLRALQAGENVSAARSAQEIFSQAKVIPKWEDGEMVGMELRDVEAGSLYEKVGLKDGDIIRTFNGIELNSTAAGAKVLSQFIDADSFEIELADGTGLSISKDEIDRFMDLGDAELDEP